MNQPQYQHIPQHMLPPLTTDAQTYVRTLVLANILTSVMFTAYDVTKEFRSVPEYKDYKHSQVKEIVHESCERKPTALAVGGIEVQNIV